MDIVTEPVKKYWLLKQDMKPIFGLENSLFEEEIKSGIQTFITSGFNCANIYVPIEVDSDNLGIEIKDKMNQLNFIEEGFYVRLSYEIDEKVYFINVELIYRYNVDEEKKMIFFSSIDGVSLKEVADKWKAIVRKRTETKKKINSNAYQDKIKSIQNFIKEYGDHKMSCICTINKKSESLYVD